MNTPKQFWHLKYEDWRLLPSSFDSKRFLVQVELIILESSHVCAEKLGKARFYGFLIDLTPEDLTYLTLRNIKIFLETRERIIDLLLKAYQDHTVHTRSAISDIIQPEVSFKGGLIQTKLNEIRFEDFMTFFPNEV